MLVGGMAPKIALSTRDTKGTKSLSVGVVPKGWPSDISYIRRPVYSKSLTKEKIAALNSPNQASPGTVVRILPFPSSCIRIAVISSLTHPASGQHGLFATQRLCPDSFIVPYLGYVHNKDDEDPASDYDLSLDRELGIGVDATKMGNEARFINDYRGVGPPGPNAEFREVWLDVGSGEPEKIMGVYVLSAGKSGKRAKGIAKGEEVLVSYGKGFWDERQKG